MDFEAYPPVVDKVVEVVLGDVVLRDVGEHNFDIFGVVERSCEVVVTYVVGDECCSVSREHTVEENFVKVERVGFSPGVTVVKQFLPMMIRRVRFGSSFLERNLHTTDVTVMLLQQSYEILP